MSTVSHNAAAATRILPEISRTQRPHSSDAQVTSFILIVYLHQFGYGGGGVKCLSVLARKQDVPKLTDRFQRSMIDLRRRWLPQYAALPANELCEAGRY